jgi:hypothetical protein
MKFRFFSYGIAAVVVSCMVPMLVVAQQVGRAPNGLVAGSAAQDAIKAAESKPTPRTADGHPDLNGYWDSPRLPKSAHVDAAGNIDINVPRSKGGNGLVIPVTLPPHRMDPNPPPYKPELLAKVKYLADHEVDSDPAFHCIPRGAPRSGPPQQIVQTPKLTMFLYQIDGGTGDQPGLFRLIPTDGRPHRADVDPSYYGDSIGHWDGDTLVVDVNQLSDETWLAGVDEGTGYFHSDVTHVIERLTRKGDTLLWEATVEDPKVLTKPWVMTPRTVVLTDDMVYQQPICQEREADHIVDRY